MVVVPARQAGNRVHGSLKGLHIWAQMYADYFNEELIYVAYNLNDVVLHLMISRLYILEVEALQKI
jgi:hypothetical protein